jgi:hypothetical protein
VVTYIDALPEPVDTLTDPSELLAQYLDAYRTAVLPALIWILFHLLQEYARHLGHLDVARELADGVVGE